MGTIIEKKSLWRETLRSMTGNFGDWKNLALIGTLFFVACSYAYFTTSAGMMAQQAGLYREIFAQHGKDKKHIEEIAKKMNEMRTPPAARAAGTSLFIVGLIFNFLFIRKFNRYEKIPGTEGDWKRFFYFLWNAVKFFGMLILAMTGILFALGVIIGVAVVLAKVAGLTGGPMKIAAMGGALGLGLLALVAYAYFFLRYRLFMIFSVAGGNSPLKDSAKLMRGQYIRVVLNGLMLTLLFCPAWAVLIGVACWYYKVMPGNPPVVGLVLSILYSVIAMVLAVQATAFRAVTVRIFYDEACKADPDFLLDFNGAKQ